ncbi:MAG TPA: hypothetical protein VGL56_18740 [Fimbriimonadaceae bacterium]|jgi:hypothetical protein
MKLRMIAAPLATLAIGVVMTATPMTASANGYRHSSDRGTWNGLALGAAALGGYGIASHQPGLAVLGLAGAGYSEIRANNDYCAPVRNDWRRPVEVRRDFRRDR